MQQEKLSIRPYARLLTMLGEQLIKNEQIALVELIKNAYDADADWVKVRFENFNDDMSAKENSRIVVEDNGSGMTPEIIRHDWMNPATPEKYIRKQIKKAQTPEKKRVIQGEKGIGRFAILKLGANITITTKTKGSDFESVIEYDFTRFDNDFISENGKEKEIYLDQIQVGYSEVSPPKLLKGSRGTIIDIQDLKGRWGRSTIGRLIRGLSNLTDPISKIAEEQTTDDFQISIKLNGKDEPVEDQEAEDIKALIENKSVLKIKGNFDSKKNAFVFIEGEGKNNKEIKMDDPKIKGLWIWRKQNNYKEKQSYECGNFKFHFHIFDFSRGIGGKYELSQKEKNTLKNHRIYLYRDGVRVYPYGDPDDDWLNIDINRGTGRAGDFFSNDQIVGWVDISYKNNPNLRDKTNREGLIDTGDAAKDFIFLISTFLSYIKQHPYSRYEQNKRGKHTNEVVQSKIVASHLSDLKSRLDKKGYRTEAREVQKIEKEYKRERDYLVQRAEITEDLAGVGLSVEMTSHDIMLMMGRARDIGKDIARLSRNLTDKSIQEQADMLVGILVQIAEGMQDVQSIFKSSKRRRKHLKIESVLDKIYKLYEGLLKKRNIQYKKTLSEGSPLVADTTDGVIMQVLINLFDNASYWLDTVEKKDKKIIITLDGNNGELIFSDNGPGIDKEDEPYIFEAFYSGKGQEGRGLGLYIARQLLERHDYRISVSPLHQRKLEGANFTVSFVKEDLQ